MKNIIKICFVLVAITGTTYISDAQSDKLKKQPQKQLHEVETPKKVIKQDENPVITGFQNDNSVKVHTEVDELPQFKGGNEALYKWIGETIKYPEAAQKNKKEGVVTAQFIIEKDGKISNATILKDEVGYGADKEVLQLLENMPYWSPGKLNNEPVRVQYSIPVSFKL